MESYFGLLQQAASVEGSTKNPPASVWQSASMLTYRAAEEHSSIPELTAEEQPSLMENYENAPNNSENARENSFEFARENSVTAPRETRKTTLNLLELGQ